MHAGCLRDPCARLRSGFGAIGAEAGFVGAGDLTGGHDDRADDEYQRQRDHRRRDQVGAARADGGGLGTLCLLNLTIGQQLQLMRARLDQSLLFHLVIARRLQEGGDQLVGQVARRPVLRFTQLAELIDAFGLIGRLAAPRPVVGVGGQPGAKENVVARVRHPFRQAIPAAQQRFVTDLDRLLIPDAIGDQQARLDERLFDLVDDGALRRIDEG